jgi:hypothetical protein
MAQKSHGRGGLNPVSTTNVSIAVIFMPAIIARRARGRNARPRDRRSRAGAAVLRRSEWFR